MLFFHSRSNELLQRVIRAAVASDASTALSAFLHSHGDKPFAQALSGLSGPVMADALSMLAAGDRVRVLPQLSRVARNRLQSLQRPARLAALGSPVRPRLRALCWLFGHRAGAPAGMGSGSSLPLSSSARTAHRSA